MPLSPQLFDKHPVLADCPLALGFKMQKVGALTEPWNVTQAQRVREAHSSFFKAGARVLTTNTAHAHAMAWAGGAHASRVEAMNMAGVALAQEAALAAGGIKPGGWEETKVLAGVPWALLGNMAQADAALLRDSFEMVGQSQGEQMVMLADAGVDGLLLWGFETSRTLKQVLTTAARASDAAPLVVFALQEDVPQKVEQLAWLCQLALDEGAQGVGVELNIHQKNASAAVERVLQTAQPYQAATALFSSLPQPMPSFAHSSQRMLQLAGLGVHILGLGRHANVNTLRALRQQLQE